jgi:hypothetical protein
LESVEEGYNDGYDGCHVHYSCYDQQDSGYRFHESDEYYEGCGRKVHVNKGHILRESRDCYFLLERLRGKLTYSQ